MRLFSSLNFLLILLIFSGYCRADEQGAPDSYYDFTQDVTRKLARITPEDRWFAPDKARHFVASMLLAGAASYRNIHRSGLNRQEAQTRGFVFSMSLGLFKEVMDSRRPAPRNHFCWKDLLYDFLGTLSGVCLLGWW